MGCSKFSLFADVEQQLIDMLNAPREEVLNLTKTERRRMAKAMHRRQKPHSVATPDKTYIRLSCRPYNGPVVIKEFSYYTPFVDTAYQKAMESVNAECRKTGIYFIDIVVLEKDRVDDTFDIAPMTTVVLGSSRLDNIRMKPRSY